MLDKEKRGGARALEEKGRGKIRIIFGGNLTAQKKEGIS